MNDERFIKLTQIDGRSIWVNARYLVTVEPRKGGGSLVVPMGDGMDYEVRETPEAVIALCCAAPAVKTTEPDPVGRAEAPRPPEPAPAVKTAEPDPVGRAEAPRPPEPASVEKTIEPVPEQAEKPVAKKTIRKPRTTKTATARTRKTVKSAAKAESADSAEPAAVAPENPAEAAPVVSPAPAPVLPAAPAPVPPPVKPVDFANAPDRSVEILRKVAKMGCRSRNRLLNTLKSQFSMSEEKSNALMAAWVDQGAIAIDGNGHVDWRK